MSQAGGASSFIDKWQARWPEWRQAMVFVPVAQRADAAAWFALLQEFSDAAWSGDDPTPGLAKLAWWQEELRGWAKGARRHPLGDVLQPRPAPWAALAPALPALHAREAPVNGPMRGATEDAFAHAVAECEAALFGPSDARDAARLVAASIAAERALARPDAAAADPSSLPGVSGATRVRHLQAALAFARLRRGGRPSSPFAALFIAWRAARAR